MRKLIFTQDKYYHIYNRGVDKREVFEVEQDYLRFLKSMKEFNVDRVDGGLYRKFLREKADSGSVAQRDSISNLEIESLSRPLVSFIAYSLLPNHYHFILRQEINNGIVKFMQRLGIAYTMYFNNKNKRSGVLFQGKFKAVEISSNEHLLWVAAYVNGNAQIHGLVEDASRYRWCSYPEYLGTKFPIGNSVPSVPSVISSAAKDIIISQFQNKEQFKSFMNDCIITMKEKKELQKYLID